MWQTSPRAAGCEGRKWVVRTVGGIITMMNHGSMFFTVYVFRILFWRVWGKRLRELEATSKRDGRLSHCHIVKISFSGICADVTVALKIHFLRPTSLIATPVVRHKPQVQSSSISPQRMISSFHVCLPSCRLCIMTNGSSWYLNGLSSLAQSSSWWCGRYTSNWVTIIQHSSDRSTHSTRCLTAFSNSVFIVDNRVSFLRAWNSVAKLDCSGTYDAQMIDLCKLAGI